MLRKSFSLIQQACRAENRYLVKKISCSFASKKSKKQSDFIDLVKRHTKTPDDLFVESLENGIFDEKNWKLMRKDMKLYANKHLLSFANKVNDIVSNSVDDIENSDNEEIPDNEQNNEKDNQFNANLSDTQIVQVKKVIDRLEEEFTYRLESLEWEEIARLSLFFGRFYNKQFLRELENEIVSREYMQITYVKTILKGYALAEWDSPDIYRIAAKTIKIAYAEMKLNDIIECAYYFSKGKVNYKNGYGVYNLVEKILREKVTHTNFKELVKMGSMIWSGNICSNELHKIIEDSVLEKFTKEIEITDLARLAILNAKYSFKNTDLVKKVEDFSANYAKYFTDKQLAQTIWGFANGNRGNKAMYTTMMFEVMNRRKLLKNRTLSFCYATFVKAGVNDQAFFDQMEDEIIFRIDTINIHYLIKILESVVLVKRHELPIFKMICHEIDRRLNEIKIKDLVKFLTVLGESKFNHVEFNFDIVNAMNIFLHNPSLVSGLDVAEATQLLYVSTIYGEDCNELGELCIRQISDALNIPKKVFCKGFYSLVKLNRQEFYNDLSFVVKELRRYGDVKYFFNHEEFIKLVWSVFNSCKTEFGPVFLTNCAEGMLEIDPNTLELGTLSLYISILKDITLLVEEELVNEKILEISESKWTRLYELDIVKGSQKETIEQMLAPKSGKAQGRKVRRKRV